MSESFDFNHWMSHRLAQVEQALDRWVSTCPSGSQPAASSAHAAPAELVEAMRYAVLDGGKRLRPLLVWASYEATCGAEIQRPNGPAAIATSGEDAAMRAACAVELIHAYSLVHDDMPCMDNDVLRRGKPTVHVQYGEASALLAGDALQALAFELLTPEDGLVTPEVQARLCGLLARAAGSTGMAGGQAIDLASVGKALNEQQLRQMHQCKTGALLCGSVMMGAHCGAPDARALKALQTYGDAMGLAFQVVDDVLDVTADSATLGKTAGKDAENDKPTYVSILGLERSKAYARELLDIALQALDESGLSHTDALRALAGMVVNRAH